MSRRPKALFAAAALTVIVATPVATALPQHDSMSTPAPSSPTPAAVEASTTAPWNVLPATPDAAPGGKSGRADINGAKLYFAEYGKGAPVILLHGGPANSNYLTGQVAALRKNHRVVVMDTRGHGRSTTDGRPLGYDLFADDVVGLMKHLGIKRADIVGWSDGGITGLDVAMRYPERVRRVVAFGANTNTSGTFADADKKPAFAAFVERAEKEYQALSPTPNGFPELGRQLGDMYSTQPNWTEAQLRTIKAPVLVMDGDHDEAIKPEHTRAIARALTHAKLRFIENTSHFAFLQNPRAFNAEMTAFLR